MITQVTSLTAFGSGFTIVWAEADVIDILIACETKIREGNIPRKGFKAQDVANRLQDVINMLDHRLADDIVKK